jgi:hypothetical protein
MSSTTSTPPRRSAATVRRSLKIFPPGCVWETLTAAGVPLDQMAGAREVSRRGIAIVQGEAEHNSQDQIGEFPGNAVQARSELRHYVGPA